MSEHFIKEIEIKNYKLFKDFKASGFGRVNLIGGKNNVGKTAFMEAIYLNTSAQDIQSYTDALGNVTLRRDKINFYLDNFRDRSNEPLRESVRRYIENIAGHEIKTNINNNKFQLIDENNGIIKYYFSLNEDIVEVNINYFSFRRKRIDNIKFLDNFGLSKKNIKDMYAQLDIDEVEIFIKFLNKFDKNIIGFKIKNDTPQVKIKNLAKDGGYLNLIETGDGTRILISIFLSFYNCIDGYLFIDEIENGIHYTNLDKLWEIILTLSKEQNVQVFATTHSKECIESYARVAKKLDDKEIGFIELGINKYGKLDSIIMDNERLQRNIKIGNEVRGW